MISRIVRTAEYGLAALFLYLGTTKFLGGGLYTRERVLMGCAELILGVLIFVLVSEIVSTPAVIAVAAAEVALFSRPPIAALACISVHGLTTWGRIALRHRGVDTGHDATDLRDDRADADARVQ